MAEPMTPPTVLDGVSSSCVLATDGHQSITGPDGLSGNQKENLEDILFRAKEKLMGPGCPMPNRAEMTRFLHDVFDMWISGERHALPDENRLTPGIADKAVAIGRLDKDVPTLDEVLAELKLRRASGKTIKSGSIEHLIGDYNIKTETRERMRGAIVKIRASLNNGTHTGLQYVTETGSFLFPTCKITYLSGMTEVKAYFEAFRAFDRFEVNRARPYNLLVAVYIARNRITTWANGADILIRPTKEPFHLMTPVDTIMQKAEPIPNKMIEAYKAYNMLKKLPSYKLYPGIGTDEDVDPVKHNSPSGQD